MEQDIYVKLIDSQTNEVQKVLWKLHETNGPIMRNINY